MVKRTLSPLIKEMKKDVRYKRLRNSFDTLPIYQLPIDQLVAEVETLHQLRDIRRLNSSSPGFVDAVVKANTGDQSIRGRLTEIIMACVSATSSLEDAVSALRYHLLMTFTDKLRTYRTKEERVQTVNMALVAFTKYIKKIATLKEIAQLVIVDIDKGAWSMSNSITALQIHTSRERNI